MKIIHQLSRVRVPATSGNLGPGFDCLGMAHPLWDEVSAEVISGPTRVDIEGEGSDELPRDASHLVASTALEVLDSLGARQPGLGLHIRAHNRIRQGRGLGSSAAAIVAGILLARGLVSEEPLEKDEQKLSREWVLEQATLREGHPDNAAPAIWGGIVASWVDSQGAHALPISAEHLEATLLVPEEILPTRKARAVLPALVPHEDAAFNLSRAIMLVLALQNDKREYFLEATQDRLHQNYRASSMPGSAQLCEELRENGFPAVISGAGPSILVFSSLPHALTARLNNSHIQVITSGFTRGAHYFDG